MGTLVVSETMNPSLREWLSTNNAQCFLFLLCRRFFFQAQFLLTLLLEFCSSHRLLCYSLSWLTCLFSIFFFKRLQAATSFLAPPLLRQVTLCCTPSRSDDGSFTSSIAWFLLLLDRVWVSSHFIVNVLTSAFQGVFITLDSSCLLDLQAVCFTSIAEDFCSLTDNENILDQTCFRYSFYEKCAHLRLSPVPNSRDPSFKTALFPK